MSQVAQQNMISQQLRTNTIVDERILSLFETLPREDFVPAAYQAFAYADFHIPLAFDECMMTPLEEALVVQSLKLTGRETILEVGTGTGFLTALLSKLSKKVISIDIHPEFITQAGEKLKAHGCDNVELHTGNAYDGFMDEAPYDCIVFTGAMKKLNERQLLQVVPQGRIFTILGVDPIMQGQLNTLQQDKTWKRSLIFETCLPALQNPHPVKPFVF